MSSTNLNAFGSTLLSMIKYIGENIPECTEKAAVVHIKAETAIDFAAENLCKSFVNELSPHVGLIASRDEAFITNILPTLPIIKDMKMTEVWNTCSDKVKAEVWNRLNTAFMLASAAANTEIAGAAANAAGFDPNSVDPNELSEMMKNIMPGMMNMLGPMMSQMGGGGGSKKQNNKAKKELAKQAADPNSPMQQMIQNSLGIDLKQKQPARNVAGSRQKGSRGANGLI